MAYNELPRDAALLRYPLTDGVHSGRLLVRNILCPVGFSQFSQRAFDYACGIARHFGARLFLQHTVQASLLESAVGNPESIHIRRQRAEMDLRRMIAKAWDEQLEHPQVFPEVKEGDIRDRIRESMEQHEIDLLVMGTHGRKGLDRLVHGSLTESIVHEVLCPVLVVSHPQRDFIAPEEPEPVHLRTFLVPTDFSPASDRALTYALRWAAEWSGKVIFFHAVERTSPARKGLAEMSSEDAPRREKEFAEAWERIQAKVSEAAPAQCEVSYEVRHGNAKEQILKIAAEKNPDLIVMGAHGLGRSAVAWGSTISEVVRDGRFPVLGVRELAA